MASQYNYFTQVLQINGDTKFLFWSEYRQKYPGGYGYSQFSWHLGQLDMAHEAQEHIDPIDRVECSSSGTWSGFGL